jgi:hypothetical protein
MIILINHNMVLGYDYSNKKGNGNKQMHLHCQHFLMANQTRSSNASGIAWWRRSMALLEATGRCHWVTTHSI